MASSRPGCRDGFMLAGRMTERRGDPRPGPRPGASPAGLVQVAHDGEAAYARCRDFSDTGMRLDLAAPLAMGTRVTIALSPTIVVCGTVAWTRGCECGIAFDGPIDSAALLAAIDETQVQPAPAATLDQLRTRRATHHLPPRREPNARLEAAFKPGLTVTVMVAPDRERRGIVRWGADDTLEFGPAPLPRP